MGTALRSLRVNPSHGTGTGFISKTTVLYLKGTINNTNHSGVIIFKGSSWILYDYFNTIYEVIIQYSTVKITGKTFC